MSRKITANEFNYECQQLGIDPYIAVENETVWDAVKSESREQVIETLKGQF